MVNCLVSIRNKATQLHEALFPQNHIISLHRSHRNLNVLFYIRLSSLIFLTAVYIWCLVLTQALFSNILYLTLQGYFWTWLYFLATMQDYLINGIGKWGRVFPLSSNLKYYIEIIYEVAFCIQFPITIVFWGFLFRPLLENNHTTMYQIVNNAIIHSGPVLCLCLDLLYNTFSFPPKHFILVFVYASFYLFFNFLYSIKVKAIYYPLNWQSPLTVVIAVSCMLIIYIAHRTARLFFEKFKKQKLDPKQAQNCNPIEGSNQENNENLFGVKMITNQVQETL